MASKPDSPNAVAIPTIGTDGRPLPADRAWLAADIAVRYLGLFKTCLEAGWVLVLADAARSHQRSLELRPDLGGWDLHVAGRAIDVSFVGMGFQPGWTVATFDKFAASYGFYPLGAERASDKNHYDSADANSKHLIGKQRFASLQEACAWVRNV